MMTCTFLVRMARKATKLTEVTINEIHHIATSKPDMKIPLQNLNSASHTQVDGMHGNGWALHFHSLKFITLRLNIMQTIQAPRTERKRLKTMPVNIIQHFLAIHHIECSVFYNDNPSLFAI